ncbi:MAG: hypothetical protein ACRDL3_13545 [Solirubrobacterales bacterium]
MAIAIAWSLALALAGTTEALLYMAPTLLLALPLALGRYPGEEILAAARAQRPARSRAVSEPRPAAAPPARALARGGGLIAAYLAERPPPAPQPV